MIEKGAEFRLGNILYRFQSVLPSGKVRVFNTSTGKCTTRPAAEVKIRMEIARINLEVASEAGLGQGRDETYQPSIRVRRGIKSLEKLPQGGK